MNETIEALYQRKSVRVFEDKKISTEEKSAIIRSAIEAPTAGCQSFCTMLDITDQFIKDKLAVTCDNQPFIATAPLVIVFLADCRRWLDSYNFANVEARNPSESDLILAMADALIASQNTVVAAESLGIGSCYIGDIIEQEEEVRKLLNLDEFVFPAAMLVYGYPTQAQRDRPKPRRFEEKFLVLENTYRRLSKEEHEEMFRTRGNLENGLDFETYITKFCKRKYMSSFSLEMARSTKRYLSHFNN